MQAIGSSKNYYLVFSRMQKEPIRLSESGGEKLAKYLTSDEVKPFVTIKDIQGKEFTIRTMTIDGVKKFEPEASPYKTVKELRLPSLVSENNQERKWR